MKQSLGALEYFFPPDFAASLEEESFLHRLLRAQDLRAKIWRQHVNDCLELALRYKLEGPDLEARLRKGDQEAFSATINELTCAKFLEGLFGIDSLHWHPQGRKGKVGEFELVSSSLSKPIFVEVKTIVSRELERMEERVMDKLRQYAEEVAVPCFLHVTVKKPGDSEDFSGKRFKGFLRQELSKLNIEDTEKSHKLPDYSDDKTGLYLEIETLSIPGKSRLQSCHIGIIGGEARFIKDEDYIHHSLQKAYEKLREEQQPCLVLLCSSTEFSIDEDAVLNALLGTLAVRYQLITGVAVSASEPETIRQPNGFYQSRRNRKLSATGIYQENFTEEGIESELEIYHNPWAASPLDYSIFEGKGVRQLIKVEEGRMEWRN
jgi:hypothetical protein